jgi:hypothetical protein
MEYHIILKRLSYPALKPHDDDDRIVTELTNALPGNSFVNMVQHAAIDGSVFSMSS